MIFLNDSFFLVVSGNWQNRDTNIDSAECRHFGRGDGHRRRPPRKAHGYSIRRQRSGQRSGHNVNGCSSGQQPVMKSVMETHEKGNRGRGGRHHHHQQQREESVSNGNRTTQQSHHQPIENPEKIKRPKSCWISSLILLGHLFVYIVRLAFKY